MKGRGRCGPDVPACVAPGGRKSALRPRIARSKTARIAAARPDNSRGGRTRTNGTRWVGIDLHRRRSRIAIIDEHGELTLQKRIPTGRETITELLGDPESTHVALEATYGWEWLAELLQDAGFDVHLAHPLRTRAIAAACVKTDAVDARTLAHLLHTGLPPEAYIAPPELRDVRDLLRHRATLVHLRTSIKNRVHALLARQGILPDHSDLFAKPAASTSPASSFPTGSEIDQRAKADERVKLLCQIRGIGRYTAMLIIAEIGEVKRFPTAKHLRQWAG
jgi:transposase